MPKPIASALLATVLAHNVLFSAESDLVTIKSEITPSAVTASSEFTTAQSAKNLINGSGLNGDRHDSASDAKTMWHSANATASSIPAPGIPAAPAWVRFDFAEPQTPSEISIWNHNQAGFTNRGFRTARIYGSNDGSNWFKLGAADTVELPQGGDTAFTCKVSPTLPVKAVIITADSNYGGNCYGLSAVKFFATRSVTYGSLPFPSRISIAPQRAYRHRADGKPGREVTLQLTGSRLYKVATLDIVADGIRESVAVDAALPNGRSSITFLLPPGVGVEKAAEVSVTLRSGKDSLQCSASIPKQRQWIVYIYPHSHVDIGYTNTQANVEIIHKRNLINGIELAKKTAQYPKDARYLWNTEVVWPVERYLNKATPAERDNILNAIRDGQLCVQAGYINDNTSVAADEEFDGFFAPARKLKEQTNTPIDTLVQVDVPGMSWGIVPAANQNGIRYILLWNNGGDRVGRSMELSHHPFWWIGPDGKSKVLCLQPGAYTPGAYAKGRLFYPSMMGQTDPDKLLQIIKTESPRSNFIDNYLWGSLGRLERSDFYPYNIFAISWAMADNTPIDADLPDAVKSWNEEYAFPHLVIASAHDIMSAFENQYGDQIPVRHGEFTEYWTDGLGSAAKQTSMNRHSKERLIQADTLWSMIRPGQPAPRADFDEAWRYVVLGSEHTWCFSNPRRQPLTNDILQVKFGYFQSAEDRSNALLEQTLQPVTDPAASTVAVFNTLSWPRTGLVVLSKQIKALKDETGNPVPIQKLSTGETVFLAKDIPALGSKNYQSVPSDGTARPEIPPAFKITSTSIENGLVKATLDPDTGDIASIISAGTEFVDGKAACRVNSYRYLLSSRKPPQDGGPGNYGNASAKQSAVAEPIGTATGPTEVKISIKENGPVLASLLVESKANGCNSLTREIRLLAGQPQVEMINVVDKIGVTDKEGIHFGFAFNIPESRTRMDIPWGGH